MRFSTFQWEIDCVFSADLNCTMVLVALFMIDVSIVANVRCTREPASAVASARLWLDVRRHCLAQLNLRTFLSNHVRPCALNSQCYVGFGSSNL